MFLKLSENLEKTLPLRRVYRGEVVDNEDPKKLGRVKCTISGIFEGDIANLPWIFKRKESQNSFDVPEIGTILEVRFPTEDIYTPFYYGLWENSTTIDDDFSEDYPNTYGFKDSTGTKVVINKTQETFKFEHSSGIKMEMDKDGNLTMTIPKDVTETIEGKKSETITGDKEVTAENIKQTANSNFEAKAGGDAKVEGDGMGSFKGTGGTDVGDSGSPTNVQGSVVNLAGGGLPVARLTDVAVGIGNLGAPTVCNIVQGSPKVTSG